MEWSELTSIVPIDPNELLIRIPRIAKDVEYATAVQTLWKEELRSRMNHTSEFRECHYEAEDGTRLFGTVIRRAGIPAETKTPGILFFHTGVGPHDVCLQWKADSLVTNEDTFPAGCIVLIADVLGDDSGWGWSSDRTKYTNIRNDVLTSDNATGTRQQLQLRIQAAINALKQTDGVDESRLAALGWCFGGHSILELGRMRLPEMKAMATFHGVFDGLLPPTDHTEAMQERGSQVLICNGEADPFVSKQSLHSSIAFLERYGHDVKLLQLTGAKHGFTNPAQDWNPNKGFAYNKDAAKVSWTAALSLLKLVLA